MRFKKRMFYACCTFSCISCFTMLSSTSHLSWQSGYCFYTRTQGLFEYSRLLYLLNMTIARFVSFGNFRSIRTLPVYQSTSDYQSTSGLSRHFRIRVLPDYQSTSGLSRVLPDYQRTSGLSGHFRTIRVLPEYQSTSGLSGHFRVIRALSDYQDTIEQ